MSEKEMPPTDDLLDYETCYFWNMQANSCEYEMLFLGCEQCKTCPFKTSYPETFDPNTGYDTQDEWLKDLWQE